MTQTTLSPLRLSMPFDVQERKPKYKARLSRGRALLGYCFVVTVALTKAALKSALIDRRERTMRADLRAYEIFMAVRDAGSMTGASKRLRITQAAVSQQIRKLKAALGQRLLDRSNRDVILTAPDLAFRHSVRDEVRLEPRWWISQLQHTDPSRAVPAARPIHVLMGFDLARKTLLRSRRPFVAV
jgi:hypothetical protein